MPATLHASLTLCNQSAGTITAALGFKDQLTWVLQGWYTILADKCHSLFGEQFTQRYYYFYAENGQGRVWSDIYTFCVHPKQAFTIRGDTDCHTKMPGAMSRGFSAIDTGDARRFTLNLTATGPGQRHPLDTTLAQMPIRAWSTDLSHTRGFGWQELIRKPQMPFGNIPQRQPTGELPPAGLYSGPLPRTPATRANSAGLYTARRLLGAKITEYTWSFHPRSVNDPKALSVLTGLLFNSNWSFNPDTGQVFVRLNDDARGGGYLSRFELSGRWPRLSDTTKVELFPQRSSENYNNPIAEPLLVGSGQMVVLIDGYFRWSDFRVQAQAYLLLVKDTASGS
jgi:uncharacterized membrane protein